MVQAGLSPWQKFELGSKIVKKVIGRPIPGGPGIKIARSDPGSIVTKMAELILADVGVNLLL